MSITKLRWLLDMAGRGSMHSVIWLQGLTRGMSVFGEASMGEELALSLL